MTIDELKDYLDQKFQAEREYTDERTRDMETKLLRAFRTWAVRIVSEDKVLKASNLGLARDFRWWRNAWTTWTSRDRRIRDCGKGINPEPQGEAET